MSTKRMSVATGLSILLLILEITQATVPSMTFTSLTTTVYYGDPVTLVCSIQSGATGQLTFSDTTGVSVVLTPTSGIPSNINPMTIQTNDNNYQITFTPPSSGSRSYQCSYGGDGQFSSNQQTLSLNVNPVDASIFFSQPSYTINSGDQLSMTVFALNPTGSPAVHNGTITFSDFIAGTTLPSGSNLPFTTYSNVISWLVNSFVVYQQNPGLTLGVHVVNAALNGDGTNELTGHNANTIVVVESPALATPTVGLMATLDAQTAQLVHFVVAVTKPDNTQVTSGTVNIILFPADTILTTVDLSNPGDPQATVAVGNYLPTSSPRIIAVFASSDNSLNSAISAGASVTVIPAAARTGIHAAIVTAQDSYVYGAPQIVSAGFQDASNNWLSGNVIWSLNGIPLVNPLTGLMTTQLATTGPTPFMYLGLLPTPYQTPYSLTAEYQGNSLYGAAPAEPVDITVTPATAVTISSNVPFYSIPYGSQVTLRLVLSVGAASGAINNAVPFPSGIFSLSEGGSTLSISQITTVSLLPIPQQLVEYDITVAGTLSVGVHNIVVNWAEPHSPPAQPYTVQVTVVPGGCAADTRALSSLDHSNCNHALSSGATCTDVCAPGYSTTNASSAGTRTCNNGALPNSVLVCIPTCPGDGTPTNTVDHSNCNTVLNNGDTCEDVCAPGYSSNATPAVRTCTDGVLPASGLNCTPNPCAPPVPDCFNRFVSCGVSIPSGQTCHVACSNNYVQSSPQGEDGMDLLCTAGTLDPMLLVCTPLGELTITASASTIRYGDSVNVTATFSNSDPEPPQLLTTIVFETSDGQGGVLNLGTTDLVDNQANLTLVNPFVIDTLTAHQIFATGGSVTSWNQVPVSVIRADTVLTISSSNPTAEQTEDVTISIIFTSVVNYPGGQGILAPSGFLSVIDNGVFTSTKPYEIAQALDQMSSSVSFTSTTFTKQGHILTFYYTGDQNYVASGNAVQFNQPVIGVNPVFETSLTINKPKAQAKGVLALYFPSSHTTLSVVATVTPTTTPPVLKTGLDFLDGVSYSFAPAPTKTTTGVQINGNQAITFTFNSTHVVTPFSTLPIYIYCQNWPAGTYAFSTVVTLRTTASSVSVKKAGTGSNVTVGAGLLFTGILEVNLLTTTGTFSWHGTGAKPLVFAVATRGGSHQSR